MKLKLSLAVLMMTHFFQPCAACDDQKDSPADAPIFFMEPLKMSRRSTYPDERTLREKRIALHLTKPRGKKPEIVIPTSLALRRGRMRRALIGHATIMRAQQADYAEIAQRVAGMQAKPKLDVDDSKITSQNHPEYDPNLNPALSEHHRHKFDRSFAKALRVANQETLPRRFTAGDAHPPSEKG